MSAPPLAGLRVLDLSRLLPGPYASLVLGDLGARVDKIEEPLVGDYLRLVPPLVGDTSAMFLALGRNKRSACLDLRKASAKAALLRMVPRYDVLLEQFRPGVMDRLGLGHDVLRTVHPGLVVCSLTGYGQDGPLARRAGHDLNYLARAGVLGLQGPADGPPQAPGFQLADVGGGLWSVIGILAALVERARTGQGTVVDVSMVEASMGFAVAGLGLLLTDHPPRRGGEALTGGIAAYATYATRDDRYVALAALEPKFWEAFCAGAGVEVDMSALAPGPHQAAIKSRLSALFATRTRDEWAAFGRQHDCCVEPVLEPEELQSDEHLRARGAFFAMDSPWGRLKQLRTPLARDRLAQDHAPPPQLGEHTTEVLREAGLTDSEISAMRAEGAAR